MLGIEFKNTIVNKIPQASENQGDIFIIPDRYSITQTTNQ